jgi:mycofactocin glycosyltransferase
MVVGVDRGTTMVAALLLLGALVPTRTRVAAATLPAVGTFEEWRRRGPALDPVRWTLVCLADNFAYAAGVWAGMPARTHERALAPYQALLIHPASTGTTAPVT